MKHSKYLPVSFKYIDKEGKRAKVCFFIPKNLKDNTTISPNNLFGVSLPLLLKDMK